MFIGGRNPKLWTMFERPAISTRPNGQFQECEHTPSVRLIARDVSGKFVWDLMALPQPSSVAPDASVQGSLFPSLHSQLTQVNFDLL